jgi:cyclopropane fatty-acyl-phospholipid synthase-like methyltransferase
LKYPSNTKIRISVTALFGIVLLSLSVHAISQGYGRDSWQKPDEVVKSLKLKPGDVIADIGAGRGYFTRLFAQAVNPGGQAVGLEITSYNVDAMKRDADQSGLDTYKAVLVESDDPGFEPQSMDVVFLCNAYHHLSNRVDYFKKVSGGLKKDGRVVIVDFYNRRMDVGPPPSHTLAKKVVLEEMKNAGYQLLSDRDFLEYQYYLEFGLK